MVRGGGRHNGFAMILCRFWVMWCREVTDPFLHSCKEHHDAPEHIDVCRGSPPRYAREPVRSPAFERARSGCEGWVVASLAQLCLPSPQRSLASG